MKRLLLIIVSLMLFIELCACSVMTTSKSHCVIVTLSKPNEEGAIANDSLYFNDESFEINNIESYQAWLNYINEQEITYNSSDLGSCDFNINHLIIYPICLKATYIDCSNITVNDTKITGNIDYAKTCYMQSKDGLGYNHIGNIIYDTYLLINTTRDVTADNLTNSIIMNNKDYDGPIWDEQSFDPGIICYKPILYIYPTETMHLNIKFEDTQYLLTTYPKYNQGWDIEVDTDGVITDCDNKHYYALYFDEIAHYHCDFTEGFYVTKENAISFLEEKLTILGFTEREMNEFIMYWLPVLEQNGYSKVYFEQTTERNEECPLIFSQSIDSMLRVIIHIQKIEYEDMHELLKEEVLNTFERRGNTIVEWGGVCYNKQ